MSQSSSYSAVIWFACTNASSRPTSKSSNIGKDCGFPVFERSKCDFSELSGDFFYTRRLIFSTGGIQAFFIVGVICARFLTRIFLDIVYSICCGIEICSGLMVFSVENVSINCDLTFVVQSSTYPSRDALSFTNLTLFANYSPYFVYNTFACYSESF